jgi:phospholipase/carboxylesterase
MDRRAFLTIAATAVPVSRALRARVLRSRAPSNGRLTARPGRVTTPFDPGTHTLAVGGTRDALLFVPASYRPGTPAPLVLALHGATGSAAGALRANQEVAERRGVVVLAPSSNGMTWDAIRGDFDDDLALINRALGEAFRQCAIDPKRVAVSGFSDGATYAVSLGLINGELFPHVMAYSAGFIIDGPRQGKPRIFLSHGRQDTILPIDRCGRRIAAELKRDGYAVQLEEFDGGHTVPAGMVETAMTWWGSKQP